MECTDTVEYDINDEPGQKLMLAFNEYERTKSKLLLRIVLMRRLMLTSSKGNILRRQSTHDMYSNSSTHRGDLLKVIPLKSDSFKRRLSVQPNCGIVGMEKSESETSGFREKVSLITV